MFQIDEGCDEQDRNENPISDRNLPRKNFPNGEKQKGSQQFDAEITKRNPDATLRATTTQEEPAHYWNILPPRNLRFAVRTKRTARFFDRDVAGQPINADVQKRADGRAGHESEHGEKRVKERDVHAIR